MTRVRLAVHVHSEWSYDGSWSLRSIAAAFRRRGYDAVLLCEHDRGFSAERQAAHRKACADASQGILLVPGIEYSDGANVVHVPTWGPVPFLGEGLETGDLLRRVHEHKGVAVLAHPSRHDAWSHLDPTWLPFLAGMELWSRKYDGWAPNPRVVQELNGAATRPVVSLDFHRRRQFAPLAMVFDGRGRVTEDVVLQAMREGRCRPEVLHLPVERFTRGRAGRVAGGLNAGRRVLARGVRKVLP